MFGKTNLLACGYQSAARAQFEAELAQAREARDTRRGFTRAVVCGVLIGLAIAAVMFACGVA